MTSSKHIAQRMKIAREAKGLSLRELARQTGINENTLVKVEHGKGNPTLRTLETLSHALGVSFIVGPSPTSAETSERLRVALMMIRENTESLNQLLNLQ